MFVKVGLKILWETRGALMIILHQMQERPVVDWGAILRVETDWLI